MKKLLALFIAFQMLIVAQAQAQTAEDEDLIKHTQTDIMIVGVAGAAGAVLGLSTLSFVSQPSMHISNIWTGAALGVIAGVVFVAYNSAQKNSEELQTKSDFETRDRTLWHSQNSRLLSFQSVQFGTQLWQTSF